MRPLVCLFVALLAGCATTDQAPPTTTLTGSGDGLMIVSLTVTPTRGHPLHWDLYDVARPGERVKYLVGYAGTSREDWAPGDKFKVMGGRLVVHRDDAQEDRDQQPDVECAAGRRVGFEDHLVQAGAPGRSARSANEGLRLRGCHLSRASSTPARGPGAAAGAPPRLASPGSPSTLAPSGIRAGCARTPNHAPRRTPCAR
jgi:hypothetical protein